MTDLLLYVLAVSVAALFAWWCWCNRPQPPAQQWTVNSNVRLLPKEETP